MNSLSRVYTAIIRGSFVAAAVLVPLLMLPWTSQMLEINKQTLVVVLSIVAALAWLGRAVVEKRFSLRVEWLLVLPVLVVLCALLSPGIVLSPYLSIIGQAGQEYTSILSLAAFGVLFFLLAHEAGDHGFQRMLFSGVVVSGLILSLYVLVTFAGLIVPAGFPLSPVGTPNGLAVYMLAVSALGCGLWLSSRDTGTHDVLPSGTWGIIVRFGVMVNALVTLLVLLAIDYPMLWLLTIVAMGTLIVFAMVRANEFPHLGRFLLPVAVFVCALVFMFLPTFIGSPYPSEVALSGGASISIISQTLTSHYLLFGSGAGTFAFDFAQYRDPVLATTNFWDVGFDRASTHFITVLATFGFVGAGLIALLILGVGCTVIAKLATERNHESWKMTFAPFVAWLTLAVGQFVYSSNFTLSFAFWLFSGLLAAQFTRPTWDVNFIRSPRAGLASSFLFVFTLVLLITTLFVTLSRYSAEVAFARALRTDQSGGLLDEVIADLDRAALRNRWSDIYYRNLGHALLLKTADVIQDPDANPVYIQELIGASVNAARKATLLAPGNAVNWELQGDVYREIAPLVSGADAFAIASFEQATELAPTDPSLHVGLARAHIVRAEKSLIAIEGDDAALAAEAETVRNAAFEAARTALDRAVALRPSYAPAQFYLAYVYESQGKVSDAITAMEYLRTTDPLDVGVAMQLGLLYLKQGKNDLAEAELERALEIAPNYANARWYLASIYEQDDDLEAAIAELEKVLELAPDNDVVEQRLERLRQGLADEQLPEPIPEETPTVGDGAATETPME